MDQQAAEVSREDIESSLVQVPEVKAARVISSPEGEIVEVHVLATPTRSPQDLVHDIESTLMARFDIAIDHGKISVAQLGTVADPGRASSMTEERGIRARICSVGVSASGSLVEATVAIEVGGVVCEGSSSAPVTRTGRRRVVAQAVLHAIAASVREGHAMALEDVGVIELARESVAVVCVTLIAPSGDRPLAGSAIVHHGEDDSIVRATLDAVNRYVGISRTA